MGQVDPAVRAQEAVDLDLRRVLGREGLGCDLLGGRQVLVRWVSLVLHSDCVFEISNIINKSICGKLTAPTRDSFLRN